MKKKRYFVLGFCSLVFLVITSIAWAVPGVISYQGELANPDGTAVADGTYSIRFRIYNVDSYGTALWEDNQSVAVMDGIYNVTIPADPVANPFPEDLLNNTSLYLGITVGADSEMSPRQEITSTFYALKAGDAETLEGHGSEDFAPIDHEHSGADITSGTISEARIPGSIARDSEITWGNLSGIPGDIADGDDVGITTESDPTVPNDLKDGVTWTEVTNRPAGLDDGDDVGITSEQDPRVGDIAEGYVPRWSDSALVTGSIYDNGNGNVGIGTTNPGEKLAIGGNLLFTSDGSNHHILMPDETRSLYIGGNQNYTNPYSIGMWSHSSLRFVTNKTERVRIDSAGRVGIGITNPASRLSNSPTAASDGDKITAPSGINWKVEDYGGYAMGIENTATGGSGLLVDSGNNSGTGSTVANFVSNDVSILFVREDGNVGIGTTTPSSALDVTGDIHVSGDITWPEKTGYYAMPASDFRPSREDADYYVRGIDELFYNYAGGIDFFWASVHLPDGATVDRISCHWTDDSDDSARLELIRGDRSTGDTIEMAKLVSIWNSSTRHLSFTESITAPIIDNRYYVYSIRLTLPGGASGERVIFHNARIRYTYSSFAP